MKVYYPFLFYILLEQAVIVTALLNKKLRHYEVIDSSDISHHVRRRDVGDNDHIREITLPVLGRTLQLELIPKPELFAGNFKAVTVDADGNEKQFMVNQNDFYQGFLKGEDNSSVSAHLHDNILTAAIESQNDTYHVEPASGHIEGDTTNKMIAYRDSDVIWNVTFSRNHTEDERYCGLSAAAPKSTTAVPDHEQKARSSRSQRSVRTKLKCGLILVADHRYFKNMGKGSESKTTVSMVNVINRVDEIFKNTDWSVDNDESYKNYGFVINEVKVHVQPGGPRYNTGGLLPIKTLLEEFSRNDWSNYCLAHLFTYQDFANGVIGLAYVGHAEESSRGGICSPADGDMWHNTGLSSSINWGNQLLTTEADIVTAHELGHNFGGEHDVQSDLECSPDTDGKYIMYPASVSGRKPNNKKFSTCSRRAIKNVLLSKAHLCFSQPSETVFCGNFRVEGKEDCDSGSLLNDRCCTKQCKLIKDAVCSDTNDKCCSGCQIANASFLCSPAQPLLCKKASYCDGKSKECPKAEPAEPGTDCIERGKCDKSGNCKPFCETVNPQWKPCLCSNDEDACFVCCIKSNNACEIYRNNSERVRLNNGRLCYDGVCRDGNCEKEAQDFINRLQDFFETLGDPSKFGEFLKDNIVGTVIVFSLIVWIPLSIVVNRIDKRRDKQAQELASWQDPFNQDLIRQPNKRRDFDVVFKKDSVFLRDSRKAIRRGGNPNRRRGPTVE